jgi:hypothetical protein
MAGTRNPNSTLSFTIADYDGEKSSQQFACVEYNILTYADFLTAIGDYKESLEKISMGAVQREILTISNKKYDPALPTDQNAQRERKWVVRYKDEVTFNVYETEIPCARVLGTGNVNLLIAGTSKADFTRQDWIDWIADFEQVARSQDGNFVTVLDAYLVGRNI